MAYLLTQIVFSLLLAGLLGAVVGWLVNGYRATSKQQNIRAELMRQSLALSQAETDNKMIEDDFRELKQRSEEAITLLTEDTRQIPNLKKNLEKSQTLVRQLLQKHDAELRHVQAENRVLAGKMRDLENREKAVTRLQMDLNTERLKMRTQATTAQATAVPGTAQAVTQKTNTAPPTAPVAALSTPETENSLSGVQTEIPLETEDQVPPEPYENKVIEEAAEHAGELSVSRSFTDTDTSFDDILDKADDVLTRFQDDPGNELESFQLELDQELDAIRRDLEEDAESEPPVLHTMAARQEQVSRNDHPVDQVLIDELGPATANNDLQTIFGIGPVTEKTLKSIGIKSFSQIARFKREHIEYVAEVLQIFPGRIERDNWVASAKKLVAGNPSASVNDFLETSEANPQLEDA